MDMPTSSAETHLRGNAHDTPNNYPRFDGLGGRLRNQNSQQDDLESDRREETTDEQNHSDDNDRGVHTVSQILTRLYTFSYLVLFAILGTLARLGLQAITFYPGAPVVFSELWANVGGSLIFGFLSEDRMLFREEWGTPIYHQAMERSRKANAKHSRNDEVDLAAAKKAHNATKKTIPLYIGLATGFCGSFTSFSSFIRDAFLALSNDLPTPLDHIADYSSASPTSTTSTVSRNGGYSFMALLAVIIATVALSLSALHVGAHFAIFTTPILPSFRFVHTRRFLDPICVFLAFGCWLGAILLSILPPDRFTSSPETWRGRATFALVFAPLGCLLRFYASQYLNPRLSSFPLGTFAVNVFGTLVLGMSWDLQHAPLGGVIGCQILQGVEDGFCGCLTTVSTWVGELVSLRKRHAYVYGLASVGVSLAGLVVVMGSMRWAVGWTEVLCLH